MYCLCLPFLTLSYDRNGQLFWRLHGLEGLKYLLPCSLQEDTDDVSGLNGSLMNTMIALVIDDSRPERLTVFGTFWDCLQSLFAVLMWGILMGINMLLRRIEHLEKGLNFTQLQGSPTLRNPVLGQFSSVQFSCSVMSDSLWPHEPQHARPPCQSPTPGVYPNSCPLSQLCHLTISSSVIPFSSCLPSFPTSAGLYIN